MSSTASKHSPTGDDTPAEKFYAQQLRVFRGAIAEATNASTDNVDKELIALVQRHLQSDRQMLASMVEQGEKWAQNGKVGGQNSSRKNFENFEQNMLNASDEERAKLPAQVREAISIVEATQQLYEQVYQEVLVMQITLRERYKPKPFALPELSEP